MVQFNVEEENLICLYHNADRRRTMAKLHAALPDMGGEMVALACLLYTSPSPRDCS